MSFVRITSNIRVNEQGAFDMLRMKNASIVSRIEKMAVRVLKRAAPVKTGRFKNSIRVVQSARRESSGVFQGFVKIMPTALHSMFVIKRTKASPGVYVPKFDARSRFGRHPGTKSNNFISANKPLIIQQAQGIINNHYGPGRLNIKRFIR